MPRFSNALIYVLNSIVLENEGKTNLLVFLPEHHSFIPHKFASSLTKILFRKTEPLNPCRKLHHKMGHNSVGFNVTAQDRQINRKL